MLRALPILALLSVAAQEEAPKPPDLHTVQRGTITPTLDLDTAFEAVDAAEVRIRPEAYTGELKILKVAAPGEVVKKGDTILTFDPAPLQKLITAGELDLRVARSAFEKSQSDRAMAEKTDAAALALSENSVKVVETSLKVFDEVEGRQMLQSADLSVKFREDAISDQQEELDQLEKMYKSEELTNATAEIVVRRARRGLERSKIFLQTTKEDAKTTKEITHPQRRLILVFAVDRERRALEGLKTAQAHGKLQREADHVRAKTALEQQEERFADLKKDLEALTVHAPFDGRVFYGPFQQGMWAAAEQMKQALRPGERTQAGLVLLTVCGAGTRVRADLPEASYFDVTIDVAATVAPVAMADVKLEGRVVSKSITTSPRGAFDLRIELKQPNPDLLPGMKGKATVTLKPVKDVVVVPSGAISKSTVSVWKAGKAEPREVKPGRNDGKMTEIKSGLQPGEQIVISK